MSHYLCKLAKGVLALLQVKPVKDRKDNPLHALHVDKTHHRPGPSSDLDEAPLNHIRRPELAPESPRTLEEREQLGQIPALPRDELRVGLPPPVGERLGLALRLGPARGLIDGLGIRLHGGVISAPHRPQQIVQLMDPTALLRHAWVHRLQGRRQPGTAIGHDQLELVAFETAPIEIHQEALPGCLTLACAPGKSETVARSFVKRET